MRFRRFLIAASVVAAAGFGGAAARGQVAVLAGSQQGRAAAKEPAAERLNEPFAVAFDAGGTMYGVEYTRGDRLFRVASGGDGRLEFIAGRFRGSRQGKAAPIPPGTAAADVFFNGLHDLAIGPEGFVYLADTFNHRICGFDPRTGGVTVVAGTGEAGFSGVGGPALAATFKQAYCSSLVPGGTALLVADIGNSRLRRIDLGTRIVTTVAGNGRSGKPLDGVAAVETPLAGPRAACASADGTVYLALREGNALVEIKQGVVRTVVNAAGKAGYGGDGGPGRDAQLAGPKYVALDTAGRVLIADTENHCIRRYDPRSERIDLIAGVPRQVGATIGADLRSTHLARPHGCTMGPDGRLVIADSDNDRVLAGRVVE